MLIFLFPRIQARKFFVGGNFKSNGSISSISSIIENLNKATLNPAVGGFPRLWRKSSWGKPTNFNPILEVVISPPALYLLLASKISRKDVAIAAQNVYDKGNGAYTGEISAEQLKDAGVNWALIGHSERRALLGESDQVRTI